MPGKYQLIVNEDGSFQGMGRLHTWDDARDALEDCVYIIQTMDQAIKDKTDEVTTLKSEVLALKKLPPRPEPIPPPKVAWDTYPHEARGKAWDHRGNAVDLSVTHSPSNDYDRSDEYFWSITHTRVEDGVKTKTSMSGHEYWRDDAMMAAVKALPNLLVKIP